MNAKPRIVSQRYAAKATDIEAAISEKDLIGIELVFHPGQSSDDNDEVLGGSPLHFVGSLPPRTISISSPSR